MNSNIETLKKEILNYKIPKHLAIILDGNGTWAKLRGFERNVGHRHGARTLVEICKYAREIGIEYLTVYAFSTENWNRPAKEVNYLMRLLEVFLREQKKNIKKGNIQLKVIGTRENLSQRQNKIIDDIERESIGCTGMHINVAFNYGSYEEIIQAVKRIASDVKNENITVDDINVELFSNYLYTAGMPPVDLMIRTSGQYRISNFLLWQIAYSELYFPTTLWPDFTPEELNKAIIEYSKRDRRFGGIKC
ncbi:MAG: isoprenyl transferase [Bacilli bacterium]|nr:isoprenyl transferase [Bacilli bacterium]